VAIVPQAGGFSPNGDGTMDTLALALAYGQAQSVLNWKVQILGAGQVAKTYTGDANSLPPALYWDGKKTDGSQASEGTYTASLAIDYGTSFKPVAVESRPFVLDLTAPKGAISLSPPLFSPIESDASLAIRVEASSNIAKLDSWSMKINDPAGNLFRSFQGKWPENRIFWDGKSSEGDLVESAEDYSVAVTVRDEFGNSSVLKSTIPVDILVEKTMLGYRILSSRIFFKPYTADFVHVAADLAAQNARRLDDLAARLKKFPDYKIKIVGHAVMINWDNAVKGKVEQEKILIPLSRGRAEAIKQALIDRGIDPGVIVTDGLGASEQLVPDSDLVNRWRNRRVAFYIEQS
jgi:outer membrane protein OmpA-like peptidoglycan-associated protein